MPPTVLLPVKCAETGAVVTIDSVSPYHEDSINELKIQLAAATGIAPEDQILLIGPPYKQLRRLDPPLVFSSSSFRDGPPTEQQEGGPRSIYLYNRRTLDESSSGAPLSDDSALGRLVSGRLSVREAAVPEELQSLVPSSRECSPSVAALLQYERLLSKHVCVGVSLVGRSGGVVEACVKVVEEVCIQRDAVHVALANLLHHFTSLQQSTTSLIDRHHSQQARHRSLLDSFEPTLAALQHKALHPALAHALQEAIASDPRAASGSGMDCAAIRKAGQGGGVEGVSLLDCVPVGRVKDWYGECREADQRLALWMTDLAEAVIRLRDGVNAQKGVALPVDVGSLWGLVEGLREQHAAQEMGLSEAQDRYQEALRTMVEALRKGDGTVGGCVAKVEEAGRAQGALLARMEERDAALTQTAHSLLSSKQQSSAWLAHVLRAISSLQSQIQALRSDLAIGEQAVGEAKRHFGHLEHLEKLGEAYDALLLEISRRRAYSRLFELKVKGAVGDIARFREGETNARAEFLRLHAGHLMPVFSHIFPGMQDRPPHFHAQNLTLEPKLPLVRPEDVDRGEEEVLRDYMACLRLGEGSEERQETEGAGLIMPPADPAVDRLQGQEALTERCLQQDLLIAKLQAQVRSKGAGEKGEERSAGEARAAVQEKDKLAAEVARLRAENEALRSGLNTLVTVMDDTRRAALAATGEGAQKDTAAMGGGGHEAAIRAAEEGGRVVRECVERLAGQVQSRGAELTAMQQATAGTPTRRKISFCEFNVGDVALFLPTSYQGESRVYLAFHHNCPHRYLSHESLESIRAGGNRLPDYILGKIVYIETLCAKDDPGSNPFKLHPGTVFYIMHVSSETP